MLASLCGSQTLRLTWSGKGRIPHCALNGEAIQRNTEVHRPGKQGREVALGPGQTGADKRGDSCRGVIFLSPGM